MSLVEVMVASGLGSLVLSAVMAITFFSARSFAAVSNYVDLDAKSRTALDKMSQEIRQADAARIEVTFEGFFELKAPMIGTEGDSRGFGHGGAWRLALFDKAQQRRDALLDLVAGGQVNFIRTADGVADILFE